MAMKGSIQPPFMRRHRLQPLAGQKIRWLGFLFWLKKIEAEFSQQKTPTNLPTFQECKPLKG
jgi:hypothetical protein